MAICKECAEAADQDRKAQDAGLSMKPLHPQPLGICGCPCQHMPAKAWEDYFACPRPTEEDTQ